MCNRDKWYYFKLKLTEQEELKNFLDCVTTAIKQSTGLSNKIVRDCYDKAKGIAPPTGATAGAAAGAGAATTPQVSNK